MKLSLSIIVVTYNCATFIQRFLTELSDSLKECTDFEILIHDNGSSDATVKLIKETALNIFVEKGENLGFSRANNILIRKSSYENILFLNPDVFGFNADFWIRLYRSWDRENPLFIKLLNEDGSFQESVAEFISLRRMFLRLAGKSVQYKLIEKQSDIDASILAFLLVSKRCLDKVGLLDESFFMYSEDVEWCFRSIKAGYRNIYNPGLALVHTGGASSKKRWSDSSIMKKKYKAEGHFIKLHYKGINKLILLLFNEIKILSLKR